MYNTATITNNQVAEDVFPDKAWQYISGNRENGDSIIIDVSTPEEFKDLRLEGAVNVNLLSRLFKSRLELMDKNKTYFVYCKVGTRSKIAQKLMVKYGFKKVYNITGGTLLWEEEGLPFATGTSGVNTFSLCPMFITIVTVRKVKKILKRIVAGVNCHKVNTTASGS